MSLLPKSEDVETDVQSNMKRLFKDVKLSKKASKKVESVLRTAILDRYKLTAITKLLEQVEKKDTSE